MIVDEGISCRQKIAQGTGGRAYHLVTISKWPDATDGGTTEARKRVAALRGSSTPSCRSEPKPHDTLRAMPASVPQPTDAPDTAWRHGSPASPHRCVGCAPDSRVQRQPDGLKDCHTLCPDTGVGVPPRWAAVDGLKDCHTLCPDTGVGVPPRWAAGRLTTMAFRVASNNLASWTFAPATVMLKGPPSRSTSRLRFTPALPRSVGLGPIRSPQNEPCPWLRLPPAIPSPRPPSLHTPPLALPTFGARYPTPPTVERCDG